MNLKCPLCILIFLVMKYKLGYVVRIIFFFLIFVYIFYRFSNFFIYVLW